MITSQWWGSLVWSWSHYEAELNVHSMQVSLCILLICVTFYDVANLKYTTRNILLSHWNIAWYFRSFCQKTSSCTHVLWNFYDNFFRRSIFGSKKTQDALIMRLPDFSLAHHCFQIGIWRFKNPNSALEFCAEWN